MKATIPILCSYTGNLWNWPCRKATLIGKRPESQFRFYFIQPIFRGRLWFLLLFFLWWFQLCFFCFRLFLEVSLLTQPHPPTERSKAGTNKAPQLLRFEGLICFTDICRYWGVDVRYVCTTWYCFVKISIVFVLQFSMLLYVIVLGTICLDIQWTCHCLYPQDPWEWFIYVHGCLIFRVHS